MDVRNTHWNLEELVELVADAKVASRRLENLRRAKGAGHDLREEVCLIALRHEERHLIWEAWSAAPSRVR